MCVLCKRMICPSFCPSKQEKAEEKTVLRGRRCALCGEGISAQGRLYYANGIPYCEECLMQTELESLIRICEINGAKALALLGFEEDLA